jgi:hypothetical protein
LECDAGKPVEAVAESLSAVAAGDVLRAEGRDGAGSGFLESLLGGEEAVASISSMDSRDEGVLGPRDEAVRVTRFDHGAIRPPIA